MLNEPMSRRAAMCRAGLGALALAGVACRPRAVAGSSVRGSDGRLTARPHPPFGSADPGLRALRMGGQRDGLLFVPASYRAAGPVPLVLLLHGAGQRADGFVERVRPLAEELGLVLLAPDSRARTWESSYRVFGPDTTFIDLALAGVFETIAVDASRVSIAGFSDGASYALSLGLVNGDLFRRIAAFSPGYVGDGARHGRPRILITHGTADTVLAIDRTSRRIVPALRDAGYHVDYREFDGGHALPPALLRAGATWMSGA